MQTWFSASLENIDPVSDKLRILHFKPKAIGDLIYDPGQFVKLGLNDGSDFQRSYSIANLSQNNTLNDGLEIAISLVEGGRASAWAFSVKPGELIDVFGPYGQFILPSEPTKRLWLVATGTGVVPFRSMFYQLQSLAQNAIEINLIVGIRSEAELLYLDAWQTLNALPSINCYYCFSQQLPKNPLENQYLGRVQSILKQVDLNPDTDCAYLCGHPEMIDDVWQLLKSSGFSVRQVKREKYVFAVKR